MRQNIGQAPAANLVVRLYTNDYLPSITSKPTDFVECVLPGYAAAPLTPSLWTGSTNSGISHYSYPAITWNFGTNGGGTTVYGYFLMDSVSGVEVWADRFSTPYAVPASGGGLDLRLDFYDNNC